MKKITFLLPFISNKPIGGFKIIFEYANRLIKDGYEINLIFPLTVHWEKEKFSRKVNYIRKHFLYQFYKDIKIKWFELDPKINQKVVARIADGFIPKSDIIFATACMTAENLNNYCKNFRGKKFYFIQGYENWGDYSEERLLNTWKMPLQKIVISKWLKDIADNLDEKAELIYNGLDFDKFNVDKDIKIRDKKNILCLYHKQELKGFKYGLEAFKILKEKYNDINVVCFGAEKNPNDLPSWITYHYNPEQKKLRELYNEASIFVGTSLGEGWGLTVSEAMQCGCSVVCTDVAGYNEMVFDNNTGLLCKPKDGKDLAEKVMLLIENDNLRFKLSKNANIFIQQFTWERAYSKLKNLIEN